VWFIALKQFLTLITAYDWLKSYTLMEFLTPCSLLAFDIGMILRDF